jgi:cytochrome P450
MGSVLKNEGAIDECTMVFVNKLKELTARKEDIDIGRLIALYAYDVIGAVLFGRSFGFVASGTDAGTFVEAVDNAVPLLHVIAAAPSYMRTLITLAAMCIPGILKQLRDIQAMSDEAKRQTQLRLERSTEENDSCHDILSQLLRIANGKGRESGFTHREVSLESWIGIIAGSDSTASSTRAILYYLMKNPSCMARAVEEIKSQEHLLSTPITYTESTKHLPYTTACIKEASRIYPSVGVSMGRVSPAQGLVLSGHHIPPGYYVGVNPQISHHDTTLFGEDALEFRPERWLESQARNYEMEKAMLMFGAGTRTCIGKNVSDNLIFFFIEERIFAFLRGVLMYL